VDAINDYIKVELEDNTKSDTVFETPYVRGYTESDRQVVPNFGYVNGKPAYFSILGMVKHGKTVLLPQDNIFMFNGFLVKPGIIAEKKTFEKTAGGLLIRQLEYFKVIDSTTFDIPNDSVLITLPQTSTRFTRDGKLNYFIEPESVLMIIDKTHRAGPEFVFLKQITEGLLQEKPVPNFGEDQDGRTVYFRNHWSEMTIKDTVYYAVKPADILAIN